MRILFSARVPSSSVTSDSDPDAVPEAPADVSDGRREDACTWCNYTVT